MIQTQSRGNKIHPLKCFFGGGIKWRLQSHKNRRFFFKLFTNVQRKDRTECPGNWSNSFSIYNGLVHDSRRGFSNQVIACNKIWPDEIQNLVQMKLGAPLLFYPYHSYKQILGHWFCILMQRCRRKIWFVKCQLQRTIVHLDVTGWFSAMIWKR